MTNEIPGSRAITIGVPRAVAFAFALVLGSTLTATALPQVEIKAQTRLALGKVRLLGDGVAEVSGQLSDKLTGDGLGAQRVFVKIGDRVVDVVTKPDGSFVTTVEVDAGPQTITLTYRGAGDIDAAVPFTVTTDPSRAQVVLSLAKTEEDRTGAKLVVTATADDAPARMDIEIAVGPPTGAKLVPYLHVTSGSPFVLTRTKVGGAGPHLVRATFAGDTARQPAITEGTIELTSGSTTTMDVASTSLAFEDDLVVTGRVRDDDDAPLPRAAVTLTSGDRRLAQGVTAEDGTYRLSIEAEQLGPGQLGIQVQSDPGKSFLRPSRATPVVIRVAPQQPVPVSYTILAFIATVAAAGGFFFARGKPWLRLRKKAPAAQVDAKPSEDAPLAGGLVSNRPSIVSTLRRPHDDGFSGVVRDTVRGRPVPEAVVWLRLGDVEREVRTQHDGSFAIEQLAVGEWTADVAAPGHVTEKFGVSIPHRGELRNVRVDLVPVREKVFQLYRRAAEPVLPEPRLWGVWSPRQIVDHVKSKRPTPALAELTDFVEELYFSSRLAAESVLPGASERVDRAIRERIRTPPAA